MNNGEQEFTDAQSLRKKAEEQLKRKQQQVGQSIEETDMKKLLHELQVHQIELEMQNEELRQAYEVAEAALKKYTLLFDMAPVGYFTINSEGSISDLNFTGADMLGERRFSLVNSNFKLFVATDSRGVFNDFLSDIHASKAKRSCEVILGYDNNPPTPVYIEGIVIEDDGKCLLSVVDISSFNR